MLTMFKLARQAQQATGFRLRIRFQRTKHKNLRSNETRKGLTVNIVTIAAFRDNKTNSVSRAQVNF